MTEILQNDDNFVNTAAEVDTARREESAAMARLQRERGLINHATGTAAELDEVIIEESAAM